MKNLTWNAKTVAVAILVACILLATTESYLYASAKARYGSFSATATVAPDDAAPAPVTPVVQGEEVTLIPMYYSRVPMATVSPEDIVTAMFAQDCMSFGTAESKEPMNPQALEDLTLSGRLIGLSTFTKARLLPGTHRCRWIGPVVRVEITSGPFQGKQGWVEEASARKHYIMGN